mmetsp:Transcript_7918/g.23831  ORF Transcript_7918/g.23831 Transcript_7918/m.23831 type:complete len:210 (-) Transcript_7918:327-956(-)
MSRSCCSRCWRMRVSSSTVSLSSATWRPSCSLLRPRSLRSPVTRPRDPSRSALRRASVQFSSSTLRMRSRVSARSDSSCACCACSALWSRCSAASSSRLRSISMLARPSCRVTSVTSRRRRSMVLRSTTRSRRRMSVSDSRPPMRSLHASMWAWREAMTLLRRSFSCSARARSRSLLSTRAMSCSVRSRRPSFSDCIEVSRGNRMDTSA